MNKLFLIAVALFCASFSVKAQVHIPAQDQSVKFSWLSDTLNNKPDPYYAMLIPVKLNGCPKVFYMQFDLGAAHTFFYQNQVKSIFAKYPGIDTGTFNIAKGNHNKPTIIGTIGEDFIDGRTLVIDYLKQQLSVLTKLPENLSQHTTLSSFMLMKRSILLPGILNNKQTILFFDTGSSAFELLTSKTTGDQLATPDALTESYPVQSWGKTLTAKTRPTNDSLTIASQKIAIKKVTYIEGASDSQVQQMLKLGIGGMIGNKLFLNDILIIDTKKKVWNNPLNSRGEAGLRSLIQKAVADQSDDLLAVITA
jgi:hypothetical protein